MQLGVGHPGQSASCCSLTQHWLSFARVSWLVNCRLFHLIQMLQLLQLLVDLHSYISWHFMANCNFHFNLRCTAVWTRSGYAHDHAPFSCPLILSTAAAYNFVYNYIEIKSKTQVATATATATATANLPHTISSCKSRKNFPPAGDTYLISSTYSANQRFVAFVFVNVPLPQLLPLLHLPLNLPLTLCVPATFWGTLPEALWPIGSAQISIRHTAVKSNLAHAICNLKHTFRAVEILISVNKYSFWISKFLLQINDK